MNIMKKKQLNLKFMGLFFCYVIIAAISRPLYFYFSFDKLYLDFIAGLIVPPIIFYLLISFDSTKHNWRQLLYLILGYVIFQFLISDIYDNHFYIKLIGLILSGALCGVTFIDRVNRWFLN